MERRGALISALLFSLVLLRCVPSSHLERQWRLESTVAAMQTDVAIELAEMRALVATTVMPPTSTPSSTSTSMMPTLTPTGEAISVPNGVVAADLLNLRSGPGLEYEVVAHLERGDPLEVRARVPAGDWVKVSTAAGMEGWVAVEHVALSIPLEGIPLSVERPPTPLPGPTIPVTEAPSPAIPITPTATTVPSGE